MQPARVAPRSLLGHAAEYPWALDQYQRRGRAGPARPAAAGTAELVFPLHHLLNELPESEHGNSAGSVILTDIALQRPDALRGAIFHEPAYAAVTSNGEEVIAGFEQIIDQGMAQGGPARTTELFLRAVAGDEVFESFDPELRDRMLGNGEVLFGIEIEPIMSYVPATDQLAGIEVPCAVVAGADNRDPASPGHWFWEASQWFADGLGVPVVVAPGAHVPQASHPRELVATIRPTSSRLAASRPMRV